MQTIKSSQILIRLALLKDKEKIIKLEKSAIKSLCKNSNDIKQIEFCCQNINIPNFKDEITFVAQKGDRIIGFASLLSHRKIVRTIYVEPTFANSGIKSKLLNALEKEAISRGINTLKVTSSLIERAFYNSQGYRDIAFCHLEKMDILIPGMAMQKKLTFSFKLDGLFDFLLRLVATTVPSALSFILAL